jgi:DnaJ like chaperone protein
MRWTGKVIGGLIGLIGGPVLAALGALIGHQFDTQAEESRDDEGPGGDPQLVSAVFFRSAFAVMGYIAKADGRVSEREIQAARTVMQQMRLSPDQIQSAIRFFTEGKEAAFPFERTIQELRQVCGRRHDLLRVFVEIQMRAALEGTNLQGPARSAIQRIGQLLGMSGLEMAHMEAVLRLQGGGPGYRPSARASAPASRMADAYKVLDIENTASNEEVTKAYRRQMSRHHPDKLVANGLPESMQELAKEKTQQIREAYEIIREHRGI